jgi:uncharacterized damage-inducible protein DinB/ketosteroid isomerase-like protein
MTQSLEQIPGALPAAFADADPAHAGRAREQAHLATLQRMLAAIAAGRGEELRGELAPEVEFALWAPAEFPWVRQARGADAVMAAISANFRQVREQRPELLSLVAQGDTLMLTGREEGVIASSGAAYQVMLAQEYGFDPQGRLARFRSVISHAGDPTEPQAAGSPGHTVDLARWFAFHHWATDRLLEAALALTAEERERELGGPFGSVRGVLAHLLGAERLWLQRWQGEAPSHWPEGFARHDPIDFAGAWTAIKADQLAVLARLASRPAGERLDYLNLQGDPYSYLHQDVGLHLVNHGTYHRGQLAHLMRQLGHAPPSTDYLRYLDATAPE